MSDGAEAKTAALTHPSVESSLHCCINLVHTMCKDNISNPKIAVGLAMVQMHLLNLGQRLEIGPSDEAQKAIDGLATLIDLY